MEDAAEDEDPDTRRESAKNRGERRTADSYEEQAAPAELIGLRADHELAQPEREHESGEGELGESGRGAELVRDSRHARQVGVDREWSEAAEHGQNEDDVGGDRSS